MFFSRKNLKIRQLMPKNADVTEMCHVTMMNMTNFNEGLLGHLSMVKALSKKLFKIIFFAACKLHPLSKWGVSFHPVKTDLKSIFAKNSILVV